MLSMTLAPRKPFPAVGCHPVGVNGELWRPKLVNDARVEDP
jgi:hypothetical protein